jgi:tetratricopeptide (TPR) repeat protein
VVYVIRVKSLARRTAWLLTLCLNGPALRAQTPPGAHQSVEALEQRAQEYIQQQKPQLAIPVLRELVSVDPKNSSAQGNLGVLLFFDGKYAEAIPYMRSAVGSEPGLSKIEALLGIAEKRTGDPKAAQNHLEHAFESLDDKKIRIEAGLELIELDSALEQLPKALATAVKLEEQAPQNPQILLAVHHISRQIMDQSLLSMTVVAPDSAEMHMIVAGELGREGDHVKSIAEFREAIRLNPRLPGVHFELAEQLRTSADPGLNAQAEAEYKAAIRVNEYDATSWRQLGGIMTAKGDFNTAEEDYKRALALQPRDSDARTGLAIVFISLNRTNEAMSLLESAVKDDPTNIVAHYRLSMLYRRAGRTAESQRETDAFHHYQELKDKLGKTFKQFAGQANPM